MTKKGFNKTDWKSIPVLERFWRQIYKTGLCWDWTGSLDSDGYGKIKIKGVGIRAHHFSYTTFKGPIADGLMVLHTCDNPGCVNPDHLFLGSQFDNMKDMVAKGRANKLKGEASPLAKLCDSDVLEIRRRHISGDPVNGGMALAREFCVSQGTILRIVTGKKWKHLLAK